jgi:hypothetical protein
MGFGVAAMRVQLDNAALRTTMERQSIIKDSLTAYLALNMRLPCPDTDFTALDGLENRVGDTTTVCASPGAGVTRAWGLVPYATLGIPSEVATDGWSNLFTYAVSNTTGQNKEWTRTAFFYSGNVGDLTVKTRLQSSGPSSNLTTSAVVVIVSHGKNAFGAYTKLGTRNELPPTNTDELDNTDGGVVSGNSIYFKRDKTDDEASNAGPPAGGGAFDDIVYYISASDLLYPLTKDGTIKSANGTLVAQFEKIKNAIYGWMLINTNNRGDTACATWGFNPRCRRLIGQDTNSDGAADNSAFAPAGTVPFSDLGLTLVDITDPWGSKILYIVGDPVYPGGTSTMMSNSGGGGISSISPSAGSFPTTSNVITLISNGPNRVAEGGVGDDVPYAVSLGAMRAYFANGNYIP